MFPTKIADSINKFRFKEALSEMMSLARLGNKYLAHIREVDAIIHLVRCFESDKITHVNSEINPIEDLDIIKT